MILKKVCGAVGAYYFALLTGACLPFGIIDDAEKISLFQKLLPTMKLEDCPLPARDWWKSALVVSGSVQILLLWKMILKKVCGAVGAYYFALLTGACLPFGILDPEKIGDK